MMRNPDDDDPPDVEMVRARRNEIRAEYSAVFLAIALAVGDPEMRMEGRTSAGADPIDQMLVNLRAAHLLADQLDVTRDEAIDNLRAQLAKLIARHGDSFIDDDTEPPDTQPTWRPPR
jgi:hypothetical protein